MKTIGSIIAGVFAVLLGVFIYMQYTEYSDKSQDSEMAEKAEDLKEEAKLEYDDVKQEVKDAFTSNEKAGADQYDSRWDDQSKAKESKLNLKAEFADINQEIKEAFEALGTNINQEFNQAEQKMAMARLERISKQLDGRLDRLEKRLDEEGKILAAADEFAQLKIVQAGLDMQVSKVKNASDSDWNEVKKDTRKTCKEANAEIAQQVDEIQEILADSK